MELHNNLLYLHNTINSKSMIHLQNQINLIIGGHFFGNHKWNNKHQESDNCFKIYYLLEGEVWIYDENMVRHTLGSKKLYIINGYKLRSYGTDGSFEVQWLHFTPMNVELQQNLNCLPTVSQLPIDIMTSREGEGLFDTISQAHSTISKLDIISLLKIQHFIHETIIAALKDIDTNNFAHFELFNRIKIAVDYIEQHYKENISISKLAALTHTSPSHFHKLFVDVMQISPYKYLIRKRMFVALALIITNNDIKQVSYELGFCNEAHFSRTFKKYYGFTAGDYKRQNLKESEYSQVKLV